MTQTKVKLKEHLTARENELLWKLQDENITCDEHTLTRLLLTEIKVIKDICVNRGKF